MESDIVIRSAEIEDAAKLVGIYKPYVLETAITFEYDVPSAEEFAERMKNTMQKYPYLVAESAGVPVGYAYAGDFVGRAAYDWSVETTVYLRQDMKKRGIGRKIYEALENSLRAMHICNLNACIGCPETEDEYLTKNSAEFHAHFGFTMVGEFHKCGYKFGRWYNMLWMEKIIGGHPDFPPAVLKFSDVRELLKEKYKIM